MFRYDKMERGHLKTILNLPKNIISFHILSCLLTINLKIISSLFR